MPGDIFVDIFFAFVNSWAVITKQKYKSWPEKVHSTLPDSFSGKHAQKMIWRRSRTNTKRKEARKNERTTQGKKERKKKKAKRKKE